MVYRRVSYSYPSLAVDCWKASTPLVNRRVTGIPAYTRSPELVVKSTVLTTRLSCFVATSKQEVSICIQTLHMLRHATEANRRNPVCRWEHGVGSRDMCTVFHMCGHQVPRSVYPPSHFSLLHWLLRRSVVTCINAGLRG